MELLDPAGKRPATIEVKPECLIRWLDRAENLEWPASRAAALGSEEKQSRSECSNRSVLNKV